MFYSNLLTFATLALVATAAPLEKRAQFTGRGTFFAVGLGNCGWTSSANEHVVALNTAQYGSTSQVSQYCGKTITITYQGNTQQATIVDSCPTCPYGGLDMSTSLFSALTGGNMGMGEMQMQWSFGSSQSSNKKATPTKTTQKAIPTTTSSTSPAPTQSATTGPNAVVIPSNTATKLQTGMPQWWQTIGNDACPNTELPDGIDPVSVSPSGNAEAADLPNACGKWVQIWNPAMNVSTKAMLTNYNLDGPNGTVYMGAAYLKIANMTSGSTIPQVIQNVTWGFLT